MTMLKKLLIKDSETCEMDSEIKTVRKQIEEIKLKDIETIGDLIFILKQHKRKTRGPVFERR